MDTHVKQVEVEHCKTVIDRGGVGVKSGEENEYPEHG